MTKEEFIVQNSIVLEKDLKDYIIEKGYSGDEAQAFIDGVEFTSHWMETHKYEG